MKSFYHQIPNEVLINFFVGGPNSRRKWRRKKGCLRKSKPLPMHWRVSHLLNWNNGFSLFLLKLQKSLTRGDTLLLSLMKMWITTVNFIEEWVEATYNYWIRIHHLHWNVSGISSYLTPKNFRHFFFENFNYSWQILTDISDGKAWNWEMFFFTNYRRG